MGGFFEFSLIALTILLAAVLFTCWLAFVIVRGGVRGVGYLLTGNRRSLAHQIGVRQCARLRCGAFNPERANFCRRCGSPLRSAGRITGPIAA